MDALGVKECVLMKKCMLGIVGAITAICMLTCTSVFADDDFGGTLDGFVMYNEVMNITCDEADSLSAISTKTKTVSNKQLGLSYKAFVPVKASDLGANILALEDSGDEEHGKVILVEPHITTVKDFIMGYYSLTVAGSGAVVYSADFYFKDFNANYRLLEPVFSSATLGDSSFNNKVNPFIVKANGDMGSIEIASKSRKEIEPNKWYNFALIVNMDDGMMTWCVDDEVLYTQDFSEQYVAGKTPTIARARIRAQLVSGLTSAGMYMDNLRTAEYAHSPSIGDITVNDTNTEVTVAVSSTLKADTVTSDSVKLYLGDTAVGATVTASGKNIVTTPSAALASATEYKVVIDETVQSSAGLSFAEEDREKTFTTKAASFDVTSVTNDGGTITAKLQNNTGEDKTAIMVVTEKDASGNIVACGFSPETAVGESGATITLSAKNSNATQCEVFFMDNWLSRLLIKKSVFSLSLK